MGNRREAPNTSRARKPLPELPKSSGTLKNASGTSGTSSGAPKRFSGVRNDFRKPPNCFRSIRTFFRSLRNDFWSVRNTSGPPEAFRISERRFGKPRGGKESTRRGKPRGVERKPVAVEPGDDFAKTCQCRNIGSPAPPHLGRYWRSRRSGRRPLLDLRPTVSRGTASYRPPKIAVIEAGPAGEGQVGGERCRVVGHQAVEGIRGAGAHEVAQPR